MTTDQFKDKAQSPQMFSGIAGHYDLLNSFLSFGLHGRWRRSLGRYLPSRNDLEVLDLATGTADVAFALCGYAQVRRVTGIDLSDGMLAVAERKIAAREMGSRISVRKADAMSLPFANNSFDALTVSFGLRNMPDLARALIEARRVLKTGGRLVALEFSLPANRLMRSVFFLYLHALVPVIGIFLSGNLRPYTYLNETVSRFPYGERLRKIFRQTGLEPLQTIQVAFGAASIYVVEKRDDPHHG